MKAAGELLPGVFAQHRDKSHPRLTPKRWIPESCSPAGSWSHLPQQTTEKWRKSLWEFKLGEICRNLMLKRNKWGKIFSFFFPLLYLNIAMNSLSLRCPWLWPVLCAGIALPPFSIVLGQILHIQLWLLSQCCVLIAGKHFYSLKKKKNPKLSLQGGFRRTKILKLNI